MTMTLLLGALKIITIVSDPAEVVMRIDGGLAQVQRSPVIDQAAVGSSQDQGASRLIGRLPERYRREIRAVGRPE